MKELQIKVTGLDTNDLVIAIQKIAIDILQGYRVGGDSDHSYPMLGYYFSIIDKNKERKNGGNKNRGYQNNRVK